MVPAVEGENSSVKGQKKHRITNSSIKYVALKRALQFLNTTNSDVSRH